jgi:hypothetical protein
MGMSGTHTETHKMVITCQFCKTATSQQPLLALRRLRAQRHSKLDKPMISCDDIETMCCATNVAEFAQHLARTTLPGCTNGTADQP